MTKEVDRRGTSGGADGDARKERCVRARKFVRAMWRREANDTVTVRQAQATKRINQGLLSDTTTRHSRERKEFSRAFSGAASTASTTAARHTHGTTTGRDPQHETNTRERSTQTEMLLRLTFLLSAVSDSNQLSHYYPPQISSSQTATTTATPTRAPPTARDT